MRRWASLPLERVIAAIEEMEDLSRAFHSPYGDRVRAVREGQE
jgi:hypothetical protein